MLQSRGRAFPSYNAHRRRRMADNDVWLQSRGRAFPFYNPHLSHPPSPVKTVAIPRAGLSLLQLIRLNLFIRNLLLQSRGRAFPSFNIRILAKYRILKVEAAIPRAGL